MALAVRDDEGEVLREMVVRAFEVAVDIVKEEEVVVVGRMETARAGTSVGARSGLGITVRTKEEETGRDDNCMNFVGMIFDVMPFFFIIIGCIHPNYVERKNDV